MPSPRRNSWSMISVEPSGSMTIAPSWLFAMEFQGPFGSRGDTQSIPPSSLSRGSKPPSTRVELSWVFCPRAGGHVVREVPHARRVGHVADLLCLDRVQVLQVPQRRCGDDVSRQDDHENPRQNFGRFLIPRVPEVGYQGRPAQRYNEERPVYVEQHRQAVKRRGDQPRQKTDPVPDRSPTAPGSSKTNLFERSFRRCLNSSIQILPRLSCP